MPEKALPKCAEALNSEIRRDALDALLDQIRRDRPEGPFLEIGTAAGGALRDMMLCFEEKDCPHMVVVDPMTYFPDQVATIRRNISRHSLDLQKVIIRISTSQQAFPRAEKAHERYGLILVDGATSLSKVTTDLMWARLLKVRGLLCLNNVDEQHRGVSLAVNRFRNKYPEYEQVRQVGPLVILRKTAKPVDREISTGDLIYAKIRSLFCRT